ncbi:MAG: hypothetical protein BWY83_00992 [bacterium ADurb.Bin478]|nr:MAG: hypothetical protein BWY83_00992 [bacterium ADurb.Bin478]
MGAVLHGAHEQQDLLLFQLDRRRMRDQDQVGALRHGEEFIDLQPQNIQAHTAQRLLPVILIPGCSTFRFTVIKHDHEDGLSILAGQRLACCKIISCSGHPVDHAAEKIGDPSFRFRGYGLRDIDPSLRRRDRFAQGVAGRPL